MKSIKRQFTLQLVVISILLYVLLRFVAAKYIAADMPFLIMIAILFAVSEVSFILISNTKEKKPRNFVYSFMFITFARLIVYIVFVVSWVYMHRPEAKPFAVTFLALYFIYTTVEITAMYKFFNR